LFKTQIFSQPKSQGHRLLLIFEKGIATIKIRAKASFFCVAHTLLKNTKNNQQEARKKLQELRLLDDILMRAFFRQDKESVQLVLRIILKNNTLKVKGVWTQDGMTNLIGRSVRLDINAEDDTGKKYNIEVQNAKDGASLKRARLNASIMDAIGSKPGEKYSDLCETYVIFITEKDPLDYGLPIYHIDRFIRENGVSVDDGTHIIYVNAEIKDNTPLGRLMHDFSCVVPKEMHCEQLANKMHYIKTDEQEVRRMCEIIEKYAQEKAAKAKTTLDNAVKLVLSGDTTVERVSKTLGVPVEDIEEALKAESSVAAN
jgi:hypothetical protein